MGSAHIEALSRPLRWEKQFRKILWTYLQESLWTTLAAHRCLMC